MDTDPTGKGQHLALNANPMMAFYLIGWIVLSAFFLVRSDQIRSDQIR